MPSRERRHMSSHHALAREKRGCPQQHAHPKQQAAIWRQARQEELCMGSVYDIDAPDVMTALHGLHPDTWGNDAACFAAPPALHKGPNQPCRRASTSPAEGPQPALQKGPNQPCRRILQGWSDPSAGLGTGTLLQGGGWWLHPDMLGRCH